MGKLVLLSLGPVFILACGVADQDSAAGASSPWSLDSIPVLDVVGTAPSGDLVFGSVAGATRLSNGTIVVADGLEHNLRYVDEQGELVRVVGRHGEGPGEFDQIEWLGQCGRDSVFVWDQDLNRVTVVDALGNDLVTFRLPNDPSAAPASIVNCSRLGVLAFLGTPDNMGQLRENGNWVHFQAPLSLADTRGHVIRKIAQTAAFEGRPLGKVTSITLTSDRLYVGTKDSAFVDVYALDGRKMRPVSVDIPPRATTAEHYERAIDIQVSRLASVDDRRVLKDLMLEWPMPEYLPPYSTLLTDPKGLLWVEISIPGDSTTWLRAIDSATIVGDLSLTQYLEVLEIGEDYILGAYDDRAGEPHVVVYRMSRGMQPNNQM